MAEQTGNPKGGPFPGDGVRRAASPAADFRGSEFKDGNLMAGDQTGGDVDAADAEAAADRLEAALDRIAVRLAEPRASGPSATPLAFDETVLSAEQIAERLDLLIGRLRAALGQRPE